MERDTVDSLAHQAKRVKTEDVIYDGRLFINTTPHIVRYKHKLTREIIEFHPDPAREIRLEYLKGGPIELNIGGMEASKPGKYKLAKGVDVPERAALIVSTLVADAICRIPIGTIEELFGTSHFIVLVPNTSPGFHERDEKGSPFATYEWICYECCL